MLRLGRPVEGWYLSGTGLPQWAVYPRPRNWGLAPFCTCKVAAVSAAKITEALISTMSTTLSATVVGLMTHKVTSEQTGPGTAASPTRSPLAGCQNKEKRRSASNPPAVESPRNRKSQESSASSMRPGAWPRGQLASATTA